MDKSHVKAGYVVVALLMTCIVSLATMGELVLVSESAVSGTLPEHANGLPGEDVFYCQESSCRESFLASDLHQADECVKCGNELDDRMIAEKTTLPADTEIYRKAYLLDSGGEATVQVVLSGKSRTSFHRPQHCLRMSGFVVEDSYVQKVELPGREPLHVMTLTLIPPYAADGAPLMGRPPRFSYTYWYVAPGHETSSLWVRTAWMAWDNAVHRTSHRWAYIGITMPRDQDGDKHDAFIVKFVESLYPSLYREEGIQDAD